MIISDEDEFTDDPHQIIPTEAIYALPFVQKELEDGFLHEFVLPASIKGFHGNYYHESGDVKPGYTCTIPWDYPLNRQGHVAVKRHSGLVAYSSYIGLVSTGIYYPQFTDLDDKREQFTYFDVVRMI